MEQAGPEETVEATSLDVFKCRLTTIRKKHEDICFFMDWSQ